MSKTPPLMDSGIYFANCETMWRKRMPDFSVISSSCGMARPLHLVVLAPGGGGIGFERPICAHACVATRKRAAKAAPHCAAVFLLKSSPSGVESWLLWLRNIELSVLGLKFPVEL